MYVHIFGIDHTKGYTCNEKTGEASEYDKINIHALEPIERKEWDLKDGSRGAREGFGSMPIKKLSCNFDRFPLVFGVNSFKELEQFVDQDCEIQFDRYGRADQVKVRT